MRKFYSQQELNSLIGTKHNHVTITSIYRFGKQMLLTARYKCDCGRIGQTRLSHLVTGRTKSCGCLVKKLIAKVGKDNLKWDNARMPDGSSSPEYNSWGAMIGRCTRETHPIFKDYGGRGIMVCERWMDFDKFLLDMGNRPKGTTLDRKDFNGNYEPGNCRWATKDTQSNNKISCVFITHNGKTMTIKQWSDITGIKYKVLHNRLRKSHWSVERCLTEQVKQSNQH